MQAGGLQQEAAATVKKVEATEDIPWSVAQIVRQRAAALPQAAQALLAVAAVAGRVAPGEMLLAWPTPRPDPLANGRMPWRTVAARGCCWSRNKQPIASPMT